MAMPEAVHDHATMEELQAGLDEIRRSPSDEGTVELIVARPRTEERRILEEGELDLERGLLGDHWHERGSRRTPDGSAHPDMQLTLINARLIDLVARDRDRWALAGDQLYVDLDLSVDNLPVGTRLSIGTALVEVTDQLHTGCAKFTARFGSDAIKFVNKSPGRELRLRGMYARVIEPGTVRRGDAIRKR